MLQAKFKNDRFKKPRCLHEDMVEIDINNIYNFLKKLGFKLKDGTENTYKKTYKNHLNLCFVFFSTQIHLKQTLLLLHYTHQYSETNYSHTFCYIYPFFPPI